MEEKDIFRPTAGRLMDQVRETLRFYHYAYNTEKSYVNWILKYIRFSGKRHPKDMGKREIERFLSHLAVNRAVAAATQNQAFNAIIFLEKCENIRLLQSLLGHKDVKTTEIYTHVMNKDHSGITSPLDDFDGFDDE